MGGNDSVERVTCPNLIGCLGDNIVKRLFTDLKVNMLIKIMCEVSIVKTNLHGQVLPGHR